MNPVFSSVAIPSAKAPTPGSTIPAASRSRRGSLTTRAGTLTFSNPFSTLRRLAIPLSMMAIMLVQGS